MVVGGEAGTSGERGRAVRGVDRRPVDRRQRQFAVELFKSMCSGCILLVDAPHNSKESRLVLLESLVSYPKSTFLSPMSDKTPEEWKEYVRSSTKSQ